MKFNWKLSQDFASFQERGHFLPRNLNIQDHTLQNTNAGDNLLMLVCSGTLFQTVNDALCFLIGWSDNDGRDAALHGCPTSSARSERCWVRIKDRVWAGPT